MINIQLVLLVGRIEKSAAGTDDFFCQDEYSIEDGEMVNSILSTLIDTENDLATLRLSINGELSEPNVIFTKVKDQWVVS
jgi:hypothetical protein